MCRAMLLPTSANNFARAAGAIDSMRAVSSSSVGVISVLGGLS